MTFSPVLQFDPIDHRYTVDGREVPSVTRILSPVAQDFSLVPRSTLETKRELGTLVHRLIELDAQDALDEASVDPELAPFLKAWRDFLDKSGLVPIASELRVFHHDRRYAGTLDLLCASTRKGARAYYLVDVKCAATTPPSVGPQTAAYEAAYRFESGSTGPLHRRCLRLMNNGRYKLDPLDDPTDWQVFLACLSIYHWRQSHGL